MGMKPTYCRCITQFIGTIREVWKEGKVYRNSTNEVTSRRNRDNQNETLSIVHGGIVFTTEGRRVYVTLKGTHNYHAGDK